MHTVLKGHLRAFGKLSFHKIRRVSGNPTWNFDMATAPCVLKERSQQRPTPQFKLKDDLRPSSDNSFESNEAEPSYSSPSSETSPQCKDSGFFTSESSEAEPSHSSYSNGHTKVSSQCKDSGPATLEHYKAGMLLSGVGDAIGFKWEFTYSGPNIHKDVQKRGGLKNLKVKLPNWRVSDDTVLHLATAEALATGKEGEELLHEVASNYKEGMKDMAGRAPGNATIDSMYYLKPGTKGGYRVPYNNRSGGCGAAMRAMCIGLRYPKPEQLSSLVAVAVETGRMTHTHPTGFLGSVASALFTAYAVQRRPITTWGLGLVKEACPIAREFVKKAGYAVIETVTDWGYFTEKWEWYLELRGLSSGTGPVIWPEQYGVAERDAAYKSFSWGGWGGSSGHDAPMIALDALLGAGSDWEELINRAALHSGDSDSTAVIACCCWGLLYGTEGVPACNYTNLEYRDRLETSAERLYKLSH